MDINDRVDDLPKEAEIENEGYVEPEAPVQVDRRALNIAYRLKESVARFPNKRAVVYPAGWDDSNRVAYTHLTFAQLDKESDCLAHGLERVGIKRGTRTIIMVPPSLDFFALTFALFKIGAVPVVVDPGMGVKRMIQCLKESKPEAFIGISKAHMLRWRHPSFFRTINTWVTVGRRWFPGVFTLKQVHQRPWVPYQPAVTYADEMAAILFTTGATGPAKGVVYTHGNFDAQVRHIQSYFDIGPEEIDLPTFPLFSLFDPALGMTAVIPDMDPTRPAEADPEKIIDIIEDQGVTNMFGSPALLNHVGDHGRSSGATLPSLKRVISAGAPVTPDIIEKFSGMLSRGAEIHTPYGATEAMPVLCLEASEILGTTRKFSEQGYGICVGRPVGDIVVGIIRITDNPIEHWSDELLVEKGEIGEIIVKGDVATRHYFEKPEVELAAKIQDGDEFWHRMGDLGWQDNKDRVWFCGRKSHRVVTDNGPLFTIPCEAIFNQHPAVFRSALVGTGRLQQQKPVICIELNKNEKSVNKDALKHELLNLAAKNPMTQEIKTVLFHDGFPVDIRHNSKIYREQLTKWAEK